MGVGRTRSVARDTMTHPISRYLRPLMERRKSKSAFGGFLSIAGLVLATGVYPSLGGGQIEALEPTTLQVQAKTILSGPYRTLPEMTGVSQGYHALHPAIDITAAGGADIYPIKPGKVVLVKVSNVGYGRHVIVDHGNGLKSLYAHMGKIKVDEGDMVDELTSLGEVGLTGHTTGYHLHMEVRKNWIPVNPIPYLKADSKN